MPVDMLVWSGVEGCLCMWPSEGLLLPASVQLGPVSIYNKMSHWILKRGPGNLCAANCSQSLILYLKCVKNLCDLVSVSDFVIWSKMLTQIINSWKKLWKNMSIPKVSTVSADGLLPSGARLSTGTVMTKFRYRYIRTVIYGPTPEELIPHSNFCERANPNILEIYSYSLTYIIRIIWNMVNTLRPEQNGWHFADDIFINKEFSVLIEAPADNKSSLVEVMDWCWRRIKPLPDLMKVQFTNVQFTMS